MHRDAKVEAVIVAAGKGTRIKSKIPKAFILLNNRPLVFFSLKIFQNHKKVKKIILVVKKDYIAKARALVKKYKLTKVKTIVPGGILRKDSVINGLRCIEKGTEFVLVHDAARPFVSKDLITQILKALKKYPAAIPGFAVCDTLKYAQINRVVKKTLKRENIFQIQTPQGFRASLVPLLLKSSRKCRFAYDDAMLVEKIKKVKIVLSKPLNIKITTPSDLKLAGYILGKK